MADLMGCYFFLFWISEIQEACSSLGKPYSYEARLWAYLRECRESLGSLSVADSGDTFERPAEYLQVRAHVEHRRNGSDEIAGLGSRGAAEYTTM